MRKYQPDHSLKPPEGKRNGEEVFFIGGSPCSGKSTVAERIAKDHNAYYFKVDDYLDEFIASAAEKGMPVCGRLDHMTADEIRMRNPSAQCDEEFVMVPEYETDTNDELTMYSWTGFYQDRPATPEEARKRAAILPKSVQEMFPDKMLVEYRSFNSGTEAEGVFASITNEKWDKGYTLHTVTMHFIAGQKEVYGIHQADIPLSDQLKDIDVQTLWKMLTSCSRIHGKHDLILGSMIMSSTAN